MHFQLMVSQQDGGFSGSFGSLVSGYFLLLKQLASDVAYNFTFHSVEVAVTYRHQKTW